MPPSPVPQFDRRQIGEKLETLRSELIACGRELRSMQGLLQGSSFVDDTLRMLDRLTCRVGVIGQVKAGKSSLINALTGKPGLLPTDVNPWTTAVTRIHFGRADAPPNVAAEFTFFEPDEWEQLANGAGQIRELTQSLVPGFKVELLHKQVDEMRRRTETRLGPELGSLLGKKHVYPLLASEDIERYICATLPDSAADEKGVYSDVIKTADLYFGRSEFGFPTTIIDTPGTNDPYLVRDEIARRTLESAHLHVVVLTPQQALSAADVALLRILRGLDKNRIMVFLNRIDQLSDPTRDVPMIVQHVREGLRRELPGTDFPVVAGSAFWADAALRGEEADIERAWSAKAQAYVQHLAQQQASAPGMSADDKAQRAQSLLTCSGLPALFAGLAQLTPESHIGRVLLRVSQSFRELAKVGENAARHELAVLSGEDLPDGPEATVEELQAAETQVKDTLARLKERGDGLLNDHCTKINETLRAAMYRFSDTERSKLREAIAAGNDTSREWTCDFTLLRQQLEEALVLAYRAAEGEMRGIETEHLLQLQQMLKRYNSDWAEPADEASIGIVLPTIGTPSIVLSLDEPWWRRWWRRSQTRERRAAALARLIEHEFSPIVAALTQAARTQLTVRQISALQEAELVYLGLIDLLQEQNRARVARQSASRAEDDLRRESPEMQRVRETQVAELKKQASEMSLLANRLESIDRDVHREDALAG
jgi:Dynamin family